MGVVLQAVNVSYRVGSKCLVHSVSLSLEAGQLLALIGPNGAGKSTLLGLLAGDLSPSAGKVLLDGKPLAAFSAAELALRRAVMPQRTFLSFAFTVEEVVRMGRYPHLARPGAHGRDRAVVEEAMVNTEIQALRDRTYPTLSGGEKARVTLARVLVQETPLVFLDEPTSHLDPRHQHLVMKLVRQLANAGGTIIVVLHDINLAAMYADQIAVLREGHLAARGQPWEVLEPELLADVFHTPFRVMRHPELACPLVLPLPPVFSSLGQHPMELASSRHTSSS